VYRFYNQVDVFDQTQINDFFNILTDIFVFTLERGFAALSDFAIKIENQYVLFAVKLGLDGIQDGLHPDVIKTLLETSNLLTLYNNSDAKSVLFKLKLLERIVPYIQNREVQGFLFLTGQLCSMSVRGNIEIRLSRFLPEH
jgi:hypothetical protein